jgi:hypothetical protein
MPTKIHQLQMKKKTTKKGEKNEHQKKVVNA